MGRGLVAGVVDLVRELLARILFFYAGQGRFHPWFLEGEGWLILVLLATNRDFQLYTIFPRHKNASFKNVAMSNFRAATKLVYNFTFLSSR